jgi:hypothetical protein
MSQAAKVLTLLPILMFIQIIVVPAPVFLGIWFLFQFFEGAYSSSSETTGVAWWAHIGGFAVGYVVATVLDKTGRNVLVRPGLAYRRQHEVLRRRVLVGGDRPLKQEVEDAIGLPLSELEHALM